MNNGSSTLQSIDGAVLTPLVRQALGSETVEVTTWETQQIHGGGDHGTAGGSAIHRVSGQASDDGQRVEWSLIVKVLHPPENRSKVSDWDYWRREACAYGSGLLDALPGGLAAPRCFGVADQPEGEVWIWMEDVADHFASVDDIGAKWPLEHYGVVARHLGQFNGAYLTGEAAIPAFPWLRRPYWLWEHTAQAGPALAQLADYRAHPLVRLAFPPDVVATLSRLYAGRADLLNALDALPQTFCHGDAFRRNLFACRTVDGEEQTVAIDWTTVGSGWIGMEIVMLIGTTVLFGEVDRSQAQELENIVMAGYLEGLADAGWAADRRQVMLGLAAYRALNILRLVPGAIGVLIDESRHASLERTLGMPVAQFAESRAGSARSAMEWEVEARELMDELWLNQSSGR